MSEQKTGSELAEVRVKRHQRKARKATEKQEKARALDAHKFREACLIGELKAAQSNNRNTKVKDKVRLIMKIVFC